MVLKALTSCRRDQTDCRSNSPNIANRPFGRLKENKMKKLIVGALAALTMMASPAAFAQDATGAQPRGYMIGSYDIKDQAGFQKYLEAAGPIVSQYGGRVIVYNPNVTAIEGSTRSVIAIAEFPSLAVAQRYYNSPEYTAARQFFTKSTEGWRIITEGAGLPQ
jgi:uncharacterized protein (DUF1330 family)